MMMDAPINQTKEAWPHRVGDRGGRLSSADLLGERGRKMNRSLTAMALLALVTLVPGIAGAKGYSSSRGGGYVNTPFGQVPMNTMRMAGGNPFMAQEIQQEQMIYQQQMLMMKQ